MSVLYTVSSRGLSELLLRAYTASRRCAWNGAQQMKKATTTATASNATRVRPDGWRTVHVQLVTRELSQEVVASLDV